MNTKNTHGQVGGIACHGAATPILNALDAYYRGEAAFEPTCERLESLHTPTTIVRNFRAVEQRKTDR